MADDLFILIGDSHSVSIGHAARARKLPFRGGPIGAGRYLDGPFFDMDPEFRLTFHDGIASDEKATNLPYGDLSDLFRCGLPILSTIGCNTKRMASPMFRYLRAQQVGVDTLSTAVLRQALLDNKPGTVAFYEAAVRADAPIRVTYSPQVFADNHHSASLRIEQVWADILQDMGIPLIDVRAATTDDQGRLRPEFRREDGTHGNQQWGDMVLQDFMAQAGLQTPPA